MFKDLWFKACVVCIEKMCGMNTTRRSWSRETRRLLWFPRLNPRQPTTFGSLRKIISEHQPQATFFMSVSIDQSFMAHHISRLKIFKLSYRYSVKIRFKPMERFLEGHQGKFPLSQLVPSSWKSLGSLRIVLFGMANYRATQSHSQIWGKFLKISIKN